MHRIDNIPDGGWWTEAARGVYIVAFGEMTKAGMDEQQALDLLGVLYHATAGEFGG